MGMKIGNFLKSLGFLVLLALGMNVFNVSVDVAWDTLLAAFAGEMKASTVLYTVACAVGIAMVTLQIWVWFSQLSAKLHGKPILDAYQKQVEADWADTRKAIEDKLIQYANVCEQYRAENEELAARLARTNGDLEHSRINNVNLEKEFTAQIHELTEELKVLRGPLELQPLTAGCSNVDSLHFDDWALNQFVIQMRAKLKAKRDEGWQNWNKADFDSLRRELANQSRRSGDEFDPVDMANYAMFLWNRIAFPGECETANPNA